MPIAHSWTEPPPVTSLGLRAGAQDVAALLAFRRSGLSGSADRRVRFGGVLVLLGTVAAVVVPAYLKEPLAGKHASDLVAVMPSIYLGFAVLAALAAVGSGGGREVVPREQLVAYPLSPVAEHFGALLLAPLNVAWLLQAWALLGTTSYVFGPTRMAFVALPVFLWIAVATAAGQCVGWAFEALRRGRHGALAARAVVAALAGATAALVVSGQLSRLLDNSPTVQIYLGAAYGSSGAWYRWLAVVGALLALLVVVVLIGLVPARWALLRPLREEARLESGYRAARPTPGSDLAVLLRIDRASVWRAVPLRRGLLILGVMPGAVALAGSLTWNLITILPGLVASGGALLFGVNAWCLDGRGALWRDSLPVDPRLAFAAKAVVLFEVLMASAAITVVLAAVRAGAPSAAEVSAVLMASLVVGLQVVATSMRWSVRHPYAVDLRSARATPAPPVVMVSYSARLAVKTTVVGLVFSMAALGPDWRLPVLLAVPFVCWSAHRLVQGARQWAEPEVRSRVISVVAT